MKIGLRGMALIAASTLLPMSGYAEQGISYNSDNSGTLYFEDKGWTGGWNFLCIDGNCVTGTKSNGRFSREVSGLTLGQTYNISIKVQDNATGQYISPEIPVVFEASIAATPTPTATPVPTVQPTSTPVPTPDPTPIPTVVPTPDPTPTATPEPTPVVTPVPTPTATIAPATPLPTPTPVATPVVTPVVTLTPSPSVQPDPTPTATPDLGYGVEEIDGNTALYWVNVDSSWPTSGDYYSCKNAEQDCYRAELVNGRWERIHTNMTSGTYNAVLKVPGLGADQYPSWTFTWAGGNGGTGGNGGGAVIPGGGITGSGGTKVVAPTLNPETLPALDIGFDLSTRQTYLVGGLGSALPGHSLFTFSADTPFSGDSACGGECSAWPPLVIESEEALLPISRLSGEIGTITRDSGELQVTYNGLPLYFRAADTVAGQTDGANGSWPLAEVSLDAPAQQIWQNALKTPSNMGTAVNGFGFGINGNTVSFQLGAVLNEVSAPGIQFYCSPDQMEFYDTDISTGIATIPAECTASDTYWYFFRYSMNNSGSGSYVMTDNFDFDPDGAYVYTALYINDGTRIDLGSRDEFRDVGANWMRFRHPRAYDGVTEAIRDASHNSSRLAELARYSIEAIETTEADGSVNVLLDLNLPLNQGLVRLEGLENGAGDAKLPTWRYQFTPGADQRSYSMGGFSYGQSFSFEMTGVVGAITSQTYNTYQYYTIGLGFHSPIGDPRLSLVGKGGTHMVYNIKNYGLEFKNGHPGAGIHDFILEKNAIFTQHLTTLEDPKEVDDFLWGHHLFHGVKLQLAMEDDPSQENLGSNPGDTGIGQEIPEIKPGSPIACGDCHFRDGRGSHVIQTANGPRIAPPTYGVGLLQYIDGREAGFTWDGSVPTVRQQIKNALVNDHGIDPNNPEDISPRNLELISKYTEFLTVPARFPGIYDKPGVKDGDRLFREVGCVDCHTAIQKTSSQAPKKFRNLTIRPYTDMKLHRVYDGVYRTAPLWGLGRNIDLLENNNKIVNDELSIGLELTGTREEQLQAHHFQYRPLMFMHDGAASTLDEAIRLHDTDGQSDAAASVNAYLNLSSDDQGNIVKFLRSL